MSSEEIMNLYNEAFLDKIRFEKNGLIITPSLYKCAECNDGVRRRFLKNNKKRTQILCKDCLKKNKNKKI